MRAGQRRKQIRALGRCCLSPPAAPTQAGMSAHSGRVEACPQPNLNRNVFDEEKGLSDDEHLPNLQHGSQIYPWSITTSAGRIERGGRDGTKRAHPGRCQLLADETATALRRTDGSGDDHPTLLRAGSSGAMGAASSRTGYHSRCALSWMIRMSDERVCQFQPDIHLSAHMKDNFSGENGYEHTRCRTKTR